jgi:hypothetical protein
MLQFIIDMLPLRLALWLIHKPFMQRYAFHVSVPAGYHMPDGIVNTRCIACARWTVCHVYDGDETQEYHCQACDTLWLQDLTGKVLISTVEHVDDCHGVH